MLLFLFNFLAVNIWLIHSLQILHLICKLSSGSACVHSFLLVHEVGGWETVRGWGRHNVKSGVA